jgi:hypothetical protein
MPELPVPQWICATVSKRGNRPEENEDATATSPDALRFAVSDGATEGWESGPWAAQLVATHVSRPPEPTTFTDWLADARNWHPPGHDGTNTALPWYVTEKQAQGSFATLAGLELRRSRQTPGWVWRAVAVGDSCLFYLRGEQLVLTFPLESAKEFGSRPALISSSPAGCPEPQWCAGYAGAGDLLLLATDAAAARLFDTEARRTALTSVGASLAARDPEALTEWCRSVQDTTNDDVTVLAVRLPAG